MDKSFAKFECFIDCPVHVTSYDDVPSTSGAALALPIKQPHVILGTVCLCLQANMPMPGYVFRDVSSFFM